MLEVVEPGVAVRDQLPAEPDLEGIRRVEVQVAVEEVPGPLEAALERDLVIPEACQPALEVDPHPRDVQAALAERAVVGGEELEVGLVEDVEPEIELIVLGGELEPVGEPSLQGDLTGGGGPAQLAGPAKVRRAAGILAGLAGRILGRGSSVPDGVRRRAASTRGSAAPVRGIDGPTRGGRGRAARGVWRSPPRPVGASPRGRSPLADPVGPRMSGHARGRRTKHRPPARRATDRGFARREGGPSACASEAVLAERRAKQPECGSFHLGNIGRPRRSLQQECRALGFLGEALGQRKDVPVEVKRRRPERKRGRAERFN